MNKTPTAACWETPMVNEMRLNGRQCALALGFILLGIVLTPRFGNASSASMPDPTIAFRTI